MGKVKQKIQLSATQLHMAREMGISITDYAKAVAKLDEHVTMTTFNPNKNPVYSIPLSELVNLWRARYGDMWVDVSEIEEEFWEEASSRLHQNNLMEAINHHSDTTPWSRLKEGA
jgi:4-hydroxyphenylpyruvate dioxygenase-like putative hemolysin